MKGWKTWLAVAMAVGYAVGGYVAEAHGADKMFELIIAALGLVGIGHKLDKASAAEIVKTLPEVAAEEVAAEVAKAFPESHKHVARGHREKG